MQPLRPPGHCICAGNPAGPTCDPTGGRAIPADPDAEAELVRRARTDPAAFGELYEAHYAAVLNYLYRLTLSVAAAEELTSDTFFKALKGLPTFEPRPPAGFRSWLYRIATNEARMRGRGRKAGPLPDEGELARVDPGDAPGAELERRQRFAEVHRALAGLPEPYRAALTLRYFEGLTHDEVAGVLGKRPGTVKSLVHRGLAKLAAALAHPGAAE